MVDLQCNYTLFSLRLYLTMLLLRPHRTVYARGFTADSHACQIAFDTNMCALVLRQSRAATPLCPLDYATDPDKT